MILAPNPIPAPAAPIPIPTAAILPLPANILFHLESPPKFFSNILSNFENTPTVPLCCNIPNLLRSAGSL